MINIYYAIWADGLSKMKSLPKNKGTWKFYGLIFMSMAMAFNIMLIMTILQSHILHYNFYDIEIDIFPGTKIDSFVSFFILFLGPPLVLNYLLIFHNNRYEELFKHYKSYNGKLYAWYFFISLFLPVILLIGGKILYEFGIIK